MRTTLLRLVCAAWLLAATAPLLAVNPVPYTEGLSFSFRINGVGNGLMTVYGEGASTIGHTTSGLSESPLGVAWLRPGKKYTVNFQASGPSEFWLSFIAPAGYELLVQDVSRDLVYQYTGGGWYSYDYSVELRPLSSTDYAALGAFGGVKIGRALSWEVGLGGLWPGRSAGRLFFREQDFSSGNSPASRARLYASIPAHGGEITVFKDGPSNQNLRQIAVPAGILDLLDDAGGGYWIRIFPWSQAQGSPGNPYILTGSPRKTIRVESSGANHLKLTETEGSAVRVSEFTASGSSSNYTWTLQEGGTGGNWLRTVTHVSSTASGTVATGGTVSTSGVYTIHTFNSSGTFTPTAALTSVEALIVAGGGGGGGGLLNVMNGGGGGGGGVIYNSAIAVSPTSYTVTVGAGGTSATNGGNSSFASLTAIGGGHGAHNAANAFGASGGSGGGEGTDQAGGPGAGTPGQGTNGGTGTGAPAYQGGGGGGAQSAGGFNGGTGQAHSISGTTLYYGGGGGGSTNAVSGSSGGAGGGGSGGSASIPQGGNGTPNTGGGGGGSAQWSTTGGSGGSGIVIIRYPTNSYRDVIETVRTGGTGGAIVAKTRYRYQNVGGWGEELTQITADPDSAALTTAYTYHTNSANRGNYRRVRSVTAPTGGWSAQEFYDDWEKRGRLKYEYRPWLDSPGSVTLNPASGRVVYYDYTTDWTGRYARPTLRQEKTNNVVTAQTTWSHGDNTGSGWPRAWANTYSYDTGSSYRTDYTESYRADSHPNEAGQPYIVKGANQTQISYNQGMGSYNSGTGVFTYQPSGGPVLRLIRVHGSTNASGAQSVSSWAGSGGGQPFPAVYLIPEKSTLEATLLATDGLPLRTERWVYTGSSQFALVDWENYTYDAAGRLTQRVAGNGATVTHTWTNGLLTSTVGADGTETQFTYDALWRTATSVKKGASSTAAVLTGGYNYPAQGDITTTSTHDGANRVTQQVVSGGSLSLTSSAAFDLAGRPSSQTAPGGYATSFAYANGGRTVTATLPGGATKVTDAYLDGQARNVTGTAVVHEHFAYNVVSGGAREMVRRQVSSGGPIMEYLYTDWLGRKTLRQVPAPTGSGYTDHAWHYNATGQLWKETRTGSAATLYEHDTLGRLFREGLDVNGSNTLDPASDDRLREHAAAYFTGSGQWWHRRTVSTFATSGSGTATVLSKVETQLTGLPSGRLARSDTFDVFGNVTTTYTEVDRANKKLVTTTDTPDSTTSAVAVAYNGLAVEARGATGITMRHEHDALGRQHKSIDPRTGTTTTAFVSGTSLVSTVTDPAGLVQSTYAYDSAGRVASVKDALNKYAYTSYTNRNEVHRQWGDTSYPVEYGYDDQGRRTTMKTYRGGSGWTGSTWPGSPGTADTTTWAYHAATGLVTSKTDAASRTVSYIYTQAGQLYQRTWARGVVTTYGYSSTTGESTSVSYSDGTPGVSIAWNRQGRPSTVTDATGTRYLDYCSCGKLAQETLPSGYFGSRVLSYQLESSTSGALGRTKGYTLTNGGATELNAAYGFDSSGRLNSITTSASGFGASTFNYGHVANSDLIASVSNSALGYSDTRTYDPYHDWIDQRSTYVGANCKAAFVYDHDALGRAYYRYSVGELFAGYGNGTQGLETDFAYNDRSEVTADSTTLGGSSTPLSGRDDYHGYDPIGNRTTIYRSGTPVSYSTNALNQYTSFGGSATHSYDYDGNLTSDGVWTYYWDGENRLIAQESPSVGRRVEYAYDGWSRQVRKRELGGWNGSSYTTVVSDLKFLHEGMNPIAEINVSTGSLVRSYFWGLDLTGALRGAGGVGGLLQTVSHSAGARFLPVFDGNGNVMGGINQTNGALEAAFEYDAFGQTVRSTGSAAGECLFRFSTKYTDSTTGLVNYGWRLYSPALGRFLSRDPIEEGGGLNLYGFVNNNPVNRWDYLGLRMQTIERCTSTYATDLLTGQRVELGRDCYVDYIDLPDDAPVGGNNPGQAFGGFPGASGSAGAGNPNSSPTQPNSAPNNTPEKPSPERCAELSKQYGQYLNAQSGGFFDTQADAQRAMIINAALGQRTDWEYSAHVIDANALATRNGVPYSGPQYFVTPAFSNWMVGEPRTNSNGTAYVSAQHDPWFTTGIGLAGIARMPDGRPTIGFPNSVIRDSVHTHPSPGGESFSGNDQWFYGDKSTGNGMTGYVVTPSSNVLSTAGYSAPVRRVDSIPQKDLQDIRGCFGDGRP